MELPAALPACGKVNLVSIYWCWRAGCKSKIDAESSTGLCARHLEELRGEDERS